MLMKLISKGAEGDLFLTTWINQKAVLKSRKKKDFGYGAMGKENSRIFMEKQN